MFRNNLQHWLASKTLGKSRKYQFRKIHVSSARKIPPLPPQYFMIVISKKQVFHWNSLPYSKMPHPKRQSLSQLNLLTLMSMTFYNVRKVVWKPLMTSLECKLVKYCVQIWSIWCFQWKVNQILMPKIFLYRLNYRIKACLKTKVHIYFCYVWEEEMYI